MMATCGDAAHTASSAPAVSGAAATFFGTLRDALGHDATSAERHYAQLTLDDAASVPAASLETAPPLELGDTLYEHPINSLLVCRETPDGERGRGLYATRDIAAGTVLLVEPALAFVSHYVRPAATKEESVNARVAKSLRWIECDPDVEALRAYRAAMPEELANCNTPLLMRLLDALGSDAATGLLRRYHPRLMRQVARADSNVGAETSGAQNKGSGGDGNLVESAPEKGSSLRAPHALDRLIDEEVASLKARDATMARFIALYHDIDEQLALALARTLGATVFHMSPAVGHTTYASALFPTTALINHACLPNAHWVHLRDRSVTYALIDIPRGAEVTANYGGPLVTALSQVWQYTMRAPLACSLLGARCRCDLCRHQARAQTPRDATAHSTAALSPPSLMQPPPSVQLRFDTVVRLCYGSGAAAPATLEQKLRLLACLIDGDDAAADAAKLEGAPDDDAERAASAHAGAERSNAAPDSSPPVATASRHLRYTAFAAWNLFLAEASTSDLGAYEAHHRRARSIFLRMIHEALPTEDHGHALGASMRVAFVSFWFGLYSHCCATMAPSAARSRFVAAITEALADAVINPRVAALSLASAALATGTDGVLLSVCESLHTAQSASHDSGGQRPGVQSV
jgi:hypothetical protein